MIRNYQNQLTMHFFAPKQFSCLPRMHKSGSKAMRVTYLASCEVLVKSKYFHTWNKHELHLSINQRMLIMSSPENQKKRTFPLDQVSYTKSWKHETITLYANNAAKKYEMKGDAELEKLLKQMDSYHNSKRAFEPADEQFLTVPPNNLMQDGSDKFNIQIVSTERTGNKSEPDIDIQDHSDIEQIENKNDLKENIKVDAIETQQHVRPLQSYERLESFIDLSDWRRDLKNGGILLINKNKKNILSETIKYTAKKVVEMGSITNVNLPTFGMKPESALETFCKCVGAAPVILEKTGKNPLERIKSFNAIVLSMSILFNDILKGFNPTLGETFQGDLGGNPVYAEQTSSKPRNVSSFLLMGKNYRLFGSLELKADIGVNEATGVFYGEVVLEFDDGHLVRGIMPRGVVQGIMFGDIRFGPTGAVYSYDPVNKLVCSYETKKGDTMAGQIGKLRPQSQAKFERMLAAGKGDGFSHLSEKEYDMVVSRVQVVYSDSISYDGRPFFSYSEAENLPLRLTKDVPKNEAILPSDSSHREDIRLRRLDDNKQSQAENDRIEQEEEKGRKLRLLYSNSSQSNSLRLNY